METFDLSCRYLAEKHDVSPSTLSRILKMQSGVSPEMVLRLSMQDNYDLWQVMKKFKFDQSGQIEPTSSLVKGKEIIHNLLKMGLEFSLVNRFPKPQQQLHLIDPDCHIKQLDGCVEHLFNGDS